MSLLRRSNITQHLIGLIDVSLSSMVDGIWCNFLMVATSVTKQNDVSPPLLNLLLKQEQQKSATLSFSLPLYVCVCIHSTMLQ